eukprot:1397006-Rhodomonas_salina.1
MSGPHTVTVIQGYYRDSHVFQVGGHVLLGPRTGTMPYVSAVHPEVQYSRISAQGASRMRFLVFDFGMRNQVQKNHKNTHNLDQTLIFLRLISSSPGTRMHHTQAKSKTNFCG